MRGRTHRKTRKNRKSGGFMPSVMGSFVANARMLTPLAIAAGYRLMDNAKQVRKNRVHTRSKAKSRRKRQ
uniref:Uncharacterized protein n=1 Tax=viral metagenome TaxID=1070528 RepID=A0A6C0IBK4_9ZZZZ